MLSDTAQRDLYDKFGKAGLDAKDDDDPPCRVGVLLRDLGDDGVHAHKAQDGRPRADVG